ncbi:hypothetical protein TM239_68430 [Bradyrhizobium sp. TM239]|nr:hypothetical protein TM233_36420 [Bradyrhizobium sp. TM233]GMP13193.1 hypothetical protein TM239_68430 [Bradyrhizobium sp. TM239]
MVGTSAIVAFRLRRLSTARRKVGTVRAIKGLADIRTRQGWESARHDLAPGATNLNKQRSWTPCIRMRHSIPRKVVHDVATLWVGSQTKDGAAIHDEAGRLRFALPVTHFT